MSSKKRSWNLDKNHSFRHRWTTVERQGLISDNFGLRSANAIVAIGQRFVIESSSDLVNWSEALTGVFSGPQFEFVDPNARDNGRRFYRVGRLP